MVFKKAQTAIEFVILVGFLMMAFTLFFLIIQQNMSDKLNDRQNAQIKEIALTVKNEINLAFQSSDGYRREFELVKNPYGGDYNIEIQENIVLVKSADGAHAISFAVQEVSGQILKDGINVIRKENGEVKLNL